LLDKYRILRLINKYKLSCHVFDKGKKEERHDNNR